jgi:hypothetical protein
MVSVEIRLFETPESLLKTKESCAKREKDSESVYDGSKILVNQSRFIALEGTAVQVQKISIEEFKEIGLLGELKPPAIEPKHSECLNSSLRVTGNKHYNSNGSFLRILDIYMKSVEISKNDMFKNEGNGIELIDVMAHNNEIKHNLIKDNII